MSIKIQDQTLLNKWNATSTQFRIPLQASLELTNRCNERCTHCYLDTYKDDPMRVLTEKDWKKIIVELRTAGCLYLILMGGETMMSPHFWSLSKFAAQMGFHVSMITNGLKINSMLVANQLKEVGLSSVTMSMYSLEPEIHDAMTSVKGSLTKTKLAIEHCLQAGVPVYVNCLLTHQNVYNVFELYDWCLERDIELKVDPMLTPKLSGDKTPLQFRVSRAQLTWFYQERAKRWVNSRPKKENIAPKNFVCNVARGKCAVTAYGELLPCIEIREPLGSLVKDSFQKLWQGPVAKRWSEYRYKDLKNSLPADQMSLCDHCMGMSDHEVGDPLEVTSFSKMVAEVKNEFAI